MVPVIAKLGNGELGLPIGPLIWALAYGTCFGGNGTLIGKKIPRNFLLMERCKGASANVVAAGISESQGYPISFNAFAKTGVPVALATVMTVSVYIIVFHVFIPWY